MATTNGEGSNLVSFDSIPKNVLQALYHEVTGKTENMSRTLHGNFKVRSADIDTLRGMIIDQINITNQECKPTETIIVRTENDKSTTYSSWERYKSMFSGDHDVTSELILKFEVVLKVPGSDRPQRLVLHISIDSTLPMLGGREGEGSMNHYIEYMILRMPGWPTISISIDFVDFVLAKNFINTIENWFSNLEMTPMTEMGRKLLKSYSAYNVASIQFSRIGMAIFLISYYFSAQNITISDCVLAVAISLIIWSIFSIATSRLSEAIRKRILSNIIPSVVVISSMDERRFNDVIGKMKSPKSILSWLISTVIVGLLVNIVSSYLYAHLMG